MTHRWNLLLLLALAVLAVVMPVGRASAAGVTCRSGCVDLSVSVSDGVPALVPGGPVAYVVSVRNSGPSTVASVVLTPASTVALRNLVYVPLNGSYNAGSGVWSGLSLANGRTATLLIAGGVDPAATGTVTESTSVAPPTGVLDRNPADNKASDTDTLAPVADLSVAVSDGTASVAAGAPASYLVTVSNGGLSTVSSLLLTDLLPATLTNVAFAPTAGAYNPATHLWSGLSLAAGRSVTMAVSGTVDPAATGKLANTVTVTAAAGVTDPRSSNNSATDTDTIATRADLAVTVSDGATTAVPGATTGYTVSVTNGGPSTATGAAVTDTLSAAATSDNWTAASISSGASAATGSGTGAIATTVTLPPGATVTFTVTAALAATATGTVINTATVTVPAGVSDPNPANNSAADTDTLTPQADLSVTDDDGATAAVAGGSSVYSILVSNAGPSTATAAPIAAALPAGIASATWTATATAGSSVATASGSGAIATTATLLPGGSATYTLTATVANGASGTIADTATVTAPTGLTDPNPGNNSATDIDNLGTTTVEFGDLHLCGVTSLGRSDGESVHDFLVASENRLGGAAAIVPTIADLDTVAAELDASFDDGGPSDFALQHLSLSRTCQVEPWQTGEFSTFTRGEWAGAVAPLTLLATDFGTVYAATDGLVVGAPAPLNSIAFDGPGAITAYLPASGAPGALDGSSDDPTSTSSGVFGGDLTALSLNVDFDAAGYRSFARTCTPAGTAACAWAPGDVVTYAPSQWKGNPTALLLLGTDYPRVYDATGETMEVGDPAGTSIFFDNAGAVSTYLPTSGPPAPLTLGPGNTEILNPTDTTAGIFGGDVVTLELNVDFSDAGYLVGGSGVKLGDLTFCNLPTATDSYPTGSAALSASLNGTTVRQFLALVNHLLGGDTTPNTLAEVAEIDPFLQVLNASFPGGILTSMSPYLVNGACP